MSEHAVTFGPGDGLVGVLRKPEGAIRRVYVLILNAGFVHRVGPGRLSVEVARRLGDAGYATLRYDGAGIGDSAPRVPPIGAVATGIADARDAMDFLAREHGATSFVVFGLCSGARHAHQVASADPRVVGTVEIDGSVYETPRAWAMAVGERISRPQALVAGAARRIVRRLSSAPQPSPAADGGEEDDEADFFPARPSREQMVEHLRVLAQRRVQMLYIFSAEWRTYRYVRQMFDAFREISLDAILTVERVERSDHMFFTRPERDRLLRVVTDWICARFD